MRKEVIQIVEPYRTRVLTFDDRIKNLEKLVLDQDQNLTIFKGHTEREMRKFAFKDSLQNRCNELRTNVHKELSGLSEKQTLMSDKVDGLSVKLYHAEQFNKSFKVLTENLKTQAEEVNITIEQFKNNILEDIEKSKTELTDKTQQCKEMVDDFNVKLK